MRNRLYINSVLVNYVKQGSFRYVEQVCQDGLGLRFGSAFSSYIEGEAYYKPDGTQEINDGDVISYCQEMDVDQDFVSLNGSTSLQVIGLFTVKKVIKGKRSYSFVAYDNLEKLNTDFSNILYNNRNNFPYTFNDFIDLVADYALNSLGVTIEKTDLNAYNLPDQNNQTIQYFYAGGLTVKDILMYFADITFQFLKCDSSGKVRFKRFSTTPDGNPAYWKNSDRYIIAPTDQGTYTGNAVINGSSQTVTLVPVFYKQDGLSREPFSFATTDALVLRKINGAATQVVIIDQGANRYTIQQNIIADRMLVTSYSFNYLSRGWDELRSLTNNYSISPTEIHLFPFRNPFFAGQILPHIEDADGNRFSSVVMKMEQTDFEVILTCSGTEEYYDDSSKNYDVADDTTSLFVAVNDLKSSVDNKVSKTGDTMTGVLEMSNTNIKVIDTAYDSDDVPPTNSMKYIYFDDKSGNHVGCIGSAILTSARSGFLLIGGRQVSGSQVENYIGLYVDSSGNPIIGIPVSAQSAWLSALGLGTSGVLPITIAQGGTGQTGISSAITNGVTPASGITISDQEIRTFGKVAQLFLTCKSTSAITNSAWTSLGTATSYKPAREATGSILGPCITANVSIQGTGNIRIRGSISANSSFSISITYLLA